MVLEKWYYGAYMSHIQSYGSTNSSTEKLAEFKGFLKQWKDALISFFISVYLDVVASLRKLSIGFQQEKHDRVKVIHQIQKFAWAMSKLQILIENNLSSLDCNLTFCKQLL